MKLSSFLNEIGFWSAEEIKKIDFDGIIWKENDKVWVNIINPEEIDKRFIDIKEIIKIIKRIDGLIKHRETERKNNNIFRKSSDELNDEFIEDLEKIKKEI